MAYTTIDDPAQYFNTVLYTGNGVNSTDSQSITGVGFQPDWVWIKNRDTTNWHILSDSVRGGNKVLYTNRTDDERSDVDWYLQTFDSDGFTVGYSGDTNGNGNSLASWNWKAGGSASSNSDGSVTSSVSANTTAGFSIVSYTGDGGTDTAGHGLGAVPQIVIVKERSEAQSWYMYNHNLGNNKIIELNTTSASYTDNTWNSTTPTSSVFTVGNNNVNENTQTYIAYCFAEKKGYSKFGGYTGNGNANGTFIYTGFKPAWIMIRGSNAATHWTIYDNKRDTSNTTTQNLRANASDAELTDHDIDMLSNGFKHRGTGSAGNGSYNYIYMAFAESPFVNSNGVPNNAR